MSAPPLAQPNPHPPNKALVGESIYSQVAKYRGYLKLAENDLDTDLK